MKIGLEHFLLSLFLLAPPTLNAQTRTAENPGLKLQKVIPRFIELKNKGALDGISKSDTLTDFSAYPITPDLKKLEAFKAIFSAGKKCDDLVLVDVHLPKRRIGYLFCSKKSPPDLLATFVEQKNTWALAPHSPPAREATSPPAKAGARKPQHP